jgi:predicted small metal-binding protein
MTKVIRCSCGVIIKGASEDALVAKAQQHAKEAHGMELTREQALSMAQPA